MGKTVVAILFGLLVCGCTARLNDDLGFPPTYPPISPPPAPPDNPLGDPPVSPIDPGEPNNPDEPVNPPLPPPTDPGNDFEGIEAGASYEKVLSLLGTPYEDPEENPGEDNLVTWRITIDSDQWAIMVSFRNNMVVKKAKSKVTVVK